MARFDVYSLSGRPEFLVLDVQADILSDLATRVVIPIIKCTDQKRAIAVQRLRPIICIGEKDYVLRTNEISAIEVKDLNECIGNIEEQFRLVVIQAIDFLFQGF